MLGIPNKLRVSINRPCWICSCSQQHRGCIVWGHLRECQGVSTIFKVLFFLFARPTNSLKKCLWFRIWHTHQKSSNSIFSTKHHSGISTPHSAHHPRQTTAARRIWLPWTAADQPATLMDLINLPESWSDPFQTPAFGSAAGLLKALFTSKSSKIAAKAWYLMHISSHESYQLIKSILHSFLSPAWTC